MNTILVVDDSKTDQQIATSALKQAGYTVVTAANDQEAKISLAAKKPDLIVLDVVLPDRSGFEICRDWKDNDATKSIPVIICSSKGSKMDKYWGMQQGADAYLAKPIDTDQLIQTVRKLI
ncbi:MAG: response regulator transcription factor [Aphanocapsa sp. GSE-SYN-MK-11-07L]|jgi:chemotaxis family two-component system response regulator PixH|nr:response regulator transcription factor [Aphanocapsa sp. GSE-SYN-MK-11-07L]